MRTTIALLTLFLFPFTVLSQTNVHIGEYEGWHIDNHNNILIFSNNCIICYNIEGKSTAKWCSDKSNRITSVDAADHLRILVFYQESYQISLLDNNLVEITAPLNLIESGLNDIVHAALSINGDIWVADLQTNSIYTLYNNLKIRYSFSFSRFGNVSEVKKMVCYNQQLWFLMNDNSWLVLDIFGQYVTRHLVEGLDNAQISKESVSFMNCGKLHEYNLNTKAVKSINYQGTHPQGCFADDNYLFLFDTYSFKVLERKNLKFQASE